MSENLGELQQDERFDGWCSIAVSTFCGPRIVGGSQRTRRAVQLTLTGNHGIEYIALTMDQVAGLLALLEKARA